MVDLKNEQRTAQQNEEKEIDKYIAQRDKNDYDKYLQAAEERKRWQKNMMSQEYENSIALSRAMKDRERSLGQHGDPLNSLAGGLG